MKKRVGPKIIRISFILILCLSWLWWGILNCLIDDESYENRVMSQKPQLSMENYLNYAKEYEAYFNDNFPFRNMLISLNSMVDYYIFKTSSNSKVIIGKEGYLFYDNPKDGDPIKLYRGSDLYSEKDLQEIAQNCLDMQTYLEDKGKEFIIFIVPNKERVFYEYMPDRYGKPAEQYRALQLVEYLRENTDIRVVYPYNELVQAKNILEENIWYKKDTHWNKIGGYVGATVLLCELGIEMPKITDEIIHINTVGNKAGDLAGMLNLNGVLQEDEYEVKGYEEHDVREEKSDFYHDIVYYANGADERTVFVYRDSFSSNMAEYIGSQFSMTCLWHRESYTNEDFIVLDSDVFIYETVERYTDNLRYFSFE